MSVGIRPGLLALAVVATGCAEGPERPGPQVVADAQAIQAVAPDAQLPAAARPAAPRHLHEGLAAQPVQAPLPTHPYVGPVRGKAFLDRQAMKDGVAQVVPIRRPDPKTAPLTGDHAKIYGCQRPADEELPDVGEPGFCLAFQDLRPDLAGNFLIDPPGPTQSRFDPFAQVHTWFHVGHAHDHFRRELDTDEMDFQLPVITSWFQLTGARTEWVDNAYWMPPASLEARGLPIHERGGIVFGQGGQRDYSYEPHTVFHEYGHAFVGGDRSRRWFVDRYGTNILTGAVHEGLADYLAATMTGDPAVIDADRHGLGRDLSRPRSCPADLQLASHADGLILASSLWQLRQELGRQIVDLLVYRAVMGADTFTAFEELGQLLVAEALLLGAPASHRVRQVLTDSGVLGCVRVWPWRPPDRAASGYWVPGRDVLDDPERQEWAPAIVGFRVDVPGDTALNLRWSDTSMAMGVDRLRLAARVGAPVEFVMGPNGREVVADFVQLDDDERQVPPRGWTVTDGGVRIIRGAMPAAGTRLYLTFLNPNREWILVSWMERTLGRPGEPAERPAGVGDEADAATFRP